MDNRSAPVEGTALPQAYLRMGSSSLTEFLGAHAPHLLPSPPSSTDSAANLPHGTTVLATTFRGGVLIAGDRRATAGHMIAQRHMDKVFVTDAYSAVGISGVAGIAAELVRLYAVELQHYEKIEGLPLSLDGKTNKLASMVRGNLELALGGLAVVPLFVGFDEDASDPERAGRIVSYDPSGGRFEEYGYAAEGSGSPYAKSSLKKLYDPDADTDAAVRAAVEALYDAADDDSATGGPDTVRRIYPSVITVTATEGAVHLPAAQVESVVEAVLAERRERGE
jgi:proteasome beta subunit